MTTQLVEMFLLRLANFGGAGRQNLVSRRDILWVSKWYPLLALARQEKVKILITLLWRLASWPTLLLFLVLVHGASHL